MWQEVREELHPKGLEIVTVGLDVGGVEAAKHFVDRANPTHPSLLDEGHKVDELFGVLNVPNGVWIDEEGVIVRPAEPAFPGRNPVMESFEELDLSQFPPDVAEMLAQAKRIKTDPAGYKAALVDWVEKGAASRYALSPDEVIARSRDPVGGRAKADWYMRAMRCSALRPGSASTRLAHSFACSTTKGSFIRISDWAGTFETVRRPTVENGAGVSKASSRGERKLRRTAR